MTPKAVQSDKNKKTVETPAKLGERWMIPKLLFQCGGKFVAANVETILAYHKWKRADLGSPKLSADEFDVRRGQGNLSSKKQGGDEPGWDFGDLHVCLFDSLDWSIPPKAQVILLNWIGLVLEHLVNRRKIPIADLVFARHILENTLCMKIRDARQRVMTQALQKVLFDPTSQVMLDFDNGFQCFDKMFYQEGHPDSEENFYRGEYCFKKHFLGTRQIPAFYNEGEDMCAEVIEELPGVKYWLRNANNNQKGFRLPTSTGDFYPDFVVLLDDGRHLVVEFKRKEAIGYSREDARHEKEIGKFWARQSKGKCLFLMLSIPTNVPDADRRNYIEQKIVKAIAPARRKKL